MRKERKKRETRKVSNNERKRKWKRLEKKRKGEKKRKERKKKIKVKWCGDFDFLYLRNQKGYCVLRNQLAAVN